MIDLEEENNKKVKAFLVGEPGNDLVELKGLIDTLGMEVGYALTLNRLEVHPAYGMGSGKAHEISNLCHENECDCIVFDYDLDPTKQRNWEKLTNKPCFDRQEVIIRIFAQRAKTKEAVLQVELARLSYSLPRLAHSYGDMARQRGGSYGSKGSGETQLELDTRHIREKIYATRKELEKVVMIRNTQRKKRTSIPLPECALIGYTNAGKSSLLNALTGSDSFVEDKLFATLDPLTRKIKLKDGTKILLTDTVGFISNLPHSLIDAFKSTLQTAEDAQLLLIVLDGSDLNVTLHYDTVIKVLGEIKALDNHKLVVINKKDKIEDPSIITNLKTQFPECVFVSAKTHEGFEFLADKISQILMGDTKVYHIPMKEAKLVESIRTNGVIIEETWLEHEILLKARVSGLYYKMIEPYKDNNELSE